jgi:uncharacterized protein (DUF433 family)
LNHLKLFEQWAEGKLKKGNFLWPKNDNINDENAVYDIQIVIDFSGGKPRMTMMRFRPNDSGSNVWTIKEWNRENDNSENGVLKHFDILSKKDFEKIINSSKYLTDLEKKKYFEEYRRENALNDLLKKNSWD